MSNVVCISTMVVALFDLGLDAQDFVNKLFPNGWEPLVVQLLAFGVLVLAGIFLGYKPIKKLLNERGNYIEQNNNIWYNNVVNGFMGVFFCFFMLP